MNNENELTGQLQAALSEFQALDTNGGVDAREYVALHNRYPAEVQDQLRFFAIITSMQEAKRANMHIDEVKTGQRKMRADLDAARYTASGTTLIAVLALTTVLGVDVTGAVASAAVTAIIAYFVQLGLAALLYKREQA